MKQHPQELSRYTIVPARLSPEEQQAGFARLRESLGTTDLETVRRVLDKGEPAPPEEELPLDLKAGLESLRALRRRQGG